ncbi:MAG: amidohydrolase [Betaproteobacteria bacterium]|nr:amidohydrolase [Betaproteobacteria bacterium]
MLITDAQVHIWAASTPERPWPARHEPHRPQPFSKDDLLREMNAAGVDRTVIVPPSWEGDRNDLGLEAARLHPDRFAVMGLLDVQAPESRGLMATWRRQPGMLGVRLALRRGAFRLLLSEGRADWLWAEAEKAGVPIMVIIDPDQIHFMDRVAERHPQLKLAMDHLCLYGGAKDEEAFSGLDKLLGLARRPNVAVKATSLPTYTSDTYPFRRLQPYLRRVYDAFGPKRIFWGTDLTRLPCTYRQAITMFTEEIPWLTAEDKEWIMGRGVCEWLGWKLP